jgi:hypothetical protein
MTVESNKEYYFRAVTFLLCISFPNSLRQPPLAEFHFLSKYIMFIRVHKSTFLFDTVRI